MFFDAGSTSAPAAPQQGRYYGRTQGHVHAMSTPVKAVAPDMRVVPCPPGSHHVYLHQVATMYTPIIIRFRIVRCWEGRSTCCTPNMLNSNKNIPMPCGGCPCSVCALICLGIVAATGILWHMATARGILYHMDTGAYVQSWCLPVP